MGVNPQITILVIKMTNITPILAQFGPKLSQKCLKLALFNKLNTMTRQITYLIQEIQHIQQPMVLVEISIIVKYIIMVLFLQISFQL